MTTEEQQALNRQTAERLGFQRIEAGDGPTYWLAPDGSAADSSADVDASKWYGDYQALLDLCGDGVPELMRWLLTRPERIKISVTSQPLPERTVYGVELHWTQRGRYALGNGDSLGEALCRAVLHPGWSETPTDENESPVKTTKRKAKANAGNE